MTKLIATNYGYTIPCPHGYSLDMTKLIATNYDAGYTIPCPHGYSLDMTKKLSLRPNTKALRSKENTKEGVLSCGL
jgi:hypothetical protein